MLKNKNIVVGVCGGIAAYKVCDLVSKLKGKGANVYVVMTKNAAEFVTPLTFQTLSGNQVYMDMFKTVSGGEWQIDHIALADKSDLMIIIPATANVIGKIAGGIADDLLTTTVLAVKTPVLIAPAMNCNMWTNKIVSDNVKKLKAFGYKFIGPASGKLACGKEGIGRLEETKKIMDEIQRYI